MKELLHQAILEKTVRNFVSYMQNVQIASTEGIGKHGGKISFSTRKQLLYEQNLEIVC